MADMSDVVLVTGAVDNPLSLRPGEYQSLPMVEADVVELCTSGRTREFRARGVAVAHVLDMARAHEDAKMAVFTCADGSRQDVAIAELIQHNALLALETDGNLETGLESTPRLIIPGKLGSTWAKGVRSIDVS